jgi:indole-3-glycerol phosphate synthase
MRALIEVHDEAELERALVLRPRLVGINNRDLNTFAVDVNTSLRLKPLIPETIHVISESGIRSAQDIGLLKQEGFSGALIGEFLLKQTDIASALKGLMDD